MYHKLSVASASIDHCDSEIPFFIFLMALLVYGSFLVYDLRANLLTFLKLSLLICKMRQLKLMIFKVPFVSKSGEEGGKWE